MVALAEGYDRYWVPRATLYSRRSEGGGYAVSQIPTLESFGALPKR